MTFKQLSLTKVADTIVRECAVVKPGEQVLIMADSDTDINAMQALAASVQAAGAEPTITIMPRRTGWGGTPPTHIAATAVEGADVVLAITSTSMGHTHCLQDALERKKIRLMCLWPSDNTEFMTDVSATADYGEIYRVTEKVAEIMNNGKTIHITSKLGTDFTALIEGMPCRVAAARALHAGELGCFPDGEAWQGPVEGTTEGIVVIDGSISTFGLLREPVKYTVRKGRVVQVDGGEQARRLGELMRTVRNADNIAEISIGTNPKSGLTGVVNFDKKGLGRVHVAIGNNLTYGGTTECAIHLDGVMLRPTVQIDGRTVVEEGVLKI